MISNHCEFTFLSFKLLGSVFNSLTVKLEIGHTVACLHFQFDFDFHALPFHFAPYLTSRRKSLRFTHKQNILVFL